MVTTAIIVQPSALASGRLNHLEIAFYTHVYATVQIAILPRLLSGTGNMKGRILYPLLESGTGGIG